MPLVLARALVVIAVCEPVEELEVKAPEDTVTPSRAAHRRS